ncbi:hypothetical protein GCM10010449_67920 [Streptomyces rectiviolaceus]|uniref:Chaplin domain-containing protein n=2 Tax=Streptomyces rectiviolaceus TaxID=332591 RepID=A0ABP6N7K6_9ACTN
MKCVTLEARREHGPGATALTLRQQITLLGPQLLRATSVDPWAGHPALPMHQLTKEQLSMSRTAKALALSTVAVAAMAGSAGIAAADAGAQGAATHSPGVISGNAVQVPVHIPVNACGNTVNIIGLLNPAFGNTCVNA